MYLTVLLALLFVVKGKSDIKDVVAKAKGDINDVIIRPTKLPDKCHNKVKNSAKDLYVTVSYELFLQNGQKVDSVEELHFKYGSKSVIQGITEGIYGMCEQEERFLNIPASKAYGVTGLENKVPPNENVIFNIKLLSLVEQTFTTAEEDFQDADINGDYRVSPEEFSAFHTRVIDEMREAMKKGGIDNIPSILQRFQGENAPQFASEDVDKNGFIDFQEFTQHIEL